MRKENGGQPCPDNILSLMGQLGHGYLFLLKASIIAFSPYKVHHCLQNKTISNLPGTFAIAHKKTHLPSTPRLSKFLGMTKKMTALNENRSNQRIGDYVTLLPPCKENIYFKKANIG